MKEKNKYSLIVIIFLLSAAKSISQTITSLSALPGPTLPNSGLIVNGGFETGAPPVDTWYQWAKTGCTPGPDRAPTGWTASADPSNSFLGTPIRYATWGRLVQGTDPGGTYPYIPPTQSGMYEVYSTSNLNCVNTNLTATSNDGGSFPLGVGSVDGNNMLYFGNGIATITGFPVPNALWVNSTSSPDNLRVYNDNSSLGSLTGPAPVTISQTVTTTVGAAYILEFWVTGEEIDLGVQKDGFFQLDIGTQTLYLAVPGSGNDHGLGNQFYYQVVFNAAATSTLIKFTNYCHPALGNWNGYLIGNVGSELVLDDVRLAALAPLPVHLVSFTGERKGNDVNLNWLVEDQVNFSHYDVERTFDLSVPFAAIGTVSASANSSDSYQYIDNLDHFQQKDVAYYRLKLADNNGAFNFSNIVKVTLNNNHRVTVYPTVLRSGDQITVSRGNSIAPAELKVTNMAGQIMSRTTFNGGSSLQIQTNGWKAGTYILTVTDAQTHNNYKVVVQ